MAIDALIYRLDRRCLFGTLLTVALTGCGGNSDLGRVSGTVKLGGEPLADALVEFSPSVGAGTPSYGRTDEDGEYTLQYSRDDQGALIGEHIVKITTYAEGDPDAEPPMEPMPERVPAQYNVQSDLKREVKSGSQTLDFDLDESGEVIQPKPDRDDE